jgi:rare lipoprotein A
VRALPADDPAPGELPRAGAGWWLQIGAFRSRDGAALLQQRALFEAGDLLPMVALFDDDAIIRVQSGPFATRELAQEAAERLRQRLGLEAAVVERR